MKTTFTFKGFEVKVHESKNEKVTAKLDEITMTVDDFSITEYAELLVKIPGLVREVGKAMNEIQRDEFELDKDIYAEMKQRAEDEIRTMTSPFNDDLEDDVFFDNNSDENPFMPKGLLKKESPSAE